MPQDQHRYVLKANWKGRGPFRPICEWMNAVGTMINNLHCIEGGSFLVTRRFIRLRVMTSKQFTGIAYVAGIKTTGLTSDGAKPYVKCDRAAGTASEQTGPPSSPFPDNEEWYEKESTFGDIHVPGI